jgi:hypothetical protein
MSAPIKMKKPGTISLSSPYLSAILPLKGRIMMRQTALAVK